MARVLVWSPEAVEDIDAIAAYIERDSPWYARAVASKIVATAESIPEYPELGRMVPEIDDPAERVFDDTTFTYEDDRFHYEEQRFVTLGLLEGIPVSIVHTETKDRIHIISFRKATRRETTIFLENL